MATKKKKKSGKSWTKKGRSLREARKRLRQQRDCLFGMIRLYDASDGKGLPKGFVKTMDELMNKHASQNARIRRLMGYSSIKAPHLRMKVSVTRERAMLLSIYRAQMARA